MEERKVDGRDMLLFVSSRDSHGKRDASGAFVPEARGFAKYHGVPDENVIHIDCTKRNPKANRVKAVETEMLRRVGANLKAICFYGHGWPSGIQFGFNKQNVDQLAELIMRCAADDVKIALFACLAAENAVRDTDHKRVGPGTDGGFADLLRDKIVWRGIRHGWVDAHKTAGHTTWNPYVVRFLCEDVDDPEYGAEGGGWIVEPRTKYWKKWVAALRKNTGKLRYGFFLEEELHIKMRLDDSWTK